MKSTKLITNGRLMVLYRKQGVKIFWNNIELTENVGFNTSLCINKKWFDSSQAKWKIMKENNKRLIFKIKWRYLPVIQTWSIELGHANLIFWTVAEEVSEDLEIDGRKVTLLVHNKYKRWINSSEEGEFRRINGWQGVAFNDNSSMCLGVRGVQNEYFYPAILFDFRIMIQNLLR